MNIFSVGLSLVVLGWICTPAVRGDQPLDVPSGIFAYVAEPDAAPAPRYQNIEQDLPAGIAPSELLADVDPEGKSDWRFGWFTYGDSHSRSVAVGLNGDSNADLFVDVNRDKRFSRDERFESQSAGSNSWCVELGAEFVTADNQYEQVDRSTLLRQDEDKGCIEIATQGVMRGFVTVDGENMRAVRVDRNSNGRWFDSQDRILLDTNGDDVADPIGERISCDSICRIGQRRFVLQSDIRGARLELAELSGVGNVVPRIEMQSDSAAISNVAGTIVSQGGVRVSIRSLDQQIECPVGNYRVESLTFDVADGDIKYWFRFSGRDLKHGITVETGESIKLDLLGLITISSKQSVATDSVGDSLIITPLLETASGLYLSGCKAGPGRATLENVLRTQSVHEGQIIDNGSSGFT